MLMKKRKSWVRNKNKKTREKIRNRKKLSHKKE